MIQWVCWSLRSRRHCLEVHLHQLQICLNRDLLCLGTPGAMHQHPACGPFTGCCPIALDKCPGVRPIGVAEVVRRILGKAILSVVDTNVQQAAGTIQFCSSQEASCEAAIHAI